MAYIFNKFFASLRSQKDTNTYPFHRRKKLGLCASLTQNELNIRFSVFVWRSWKLVECERVQVSCWWWNENVARCIFNTRGENVCLFKSVALENYVASEWKSYMQTNKTGNWLTRTFTWIFTIYCLYLKYTRCVHYTSLSHLVCNDTNLFVRTRHSFYGLMISMRLNILIYSVCVCVEEEVVGVEEVLEAIICEWNWRRSLY